MKFAEHLAAHITPEWRKQYINYEEMKVMLYTGVEQAPAVEQSDTRPAEQYFAAFDESFFHYCENELAKINTFYSEKLAEATRKYCALDSELHSAMMQSSSGGGGRGRGRVWGAPPPARKLKALRHAFSEYYLSLVLLQNYQSLNFTGFRKILKKHDKLLNVSRGSKWREDSVEAAHFYMNKEIDRLIGETEQAVTVGLEAGDRQRAMRRLRVPPLGQPRPPWTTFRVGLFSGIFITLLGCVIMSLLLTPHPEDYPIFLRLYRGPLLLVLFGLLWAVNVHGWRSRGVNHVLIFSLDPRHHMSEQQLGALAGAAGSLWALAFLHRRQLGLPDIAAPAAMYAVGAAVLFNPMEVCHGNARFWLIRVLGRIICAPLYFVNFADFWVADQLNSMVPVLLDAQYAVCYCLLQDHHTCNNNFMWISGCVSALPAWWRCVQCLRRYRDTGERMPHLPNAAKYACAFLVILFASLSANCRECVWVWAWGVTGLLAACASHAWDVRLDWGLLDAQPGDPPLLRQEMVYSSTSFYYFGIVEDFLLRVCWVASISLTEMRLRHGDLIVTVLAPLEVFRRFMWNFFRLENEHLNNCGKFRAVRDISVAPMEAGDQAAILRLMDQPD